jgi:hypothetical protein
MAAQNSLDMARVLMGMLIGADHRIAGPVDVQREFAGAQLVRVVHNEWIELPDNADRQPGAIRPGEVCTLFLLFFF